MMMMMMMIPDFYRYSSITISITMNAVMKIIFINYHPHHQILA